MKIFTKNSIAISALATICMLASIITNQPNAAAMWVSPMATKIELTPGEAYNSTLVVSNPNTAKSDLEFILTTGPFSITGENYAVDLDTENDHTLMKDWITFDRDTGVVAPGETMTVNYTINVPTDVPDGGQYATILVREIKSAPNDKTGDENTATITNIAEVASVIYASVAGNTRSTGSIIANHIPAIITKTPLEVSSTVENTGNIHMDAIYKLQVFPLLSDEEVYTNEEKPETYIIMPDSRRMITQKWDGAVFAGIFKVRQTVEFAGQTSAVEKFVIICPLWLLIVILVAIAAIIVWLFSKSKGRKKSKK